MKLVLPALVIASLAASAPAEATKPVGGTPPDTACSVGVGPDTRLESAFRLSDGTLLVGGGATSLSWLPAGTRVVKLGGAVPTGSATGRTAFILHLSADATRILEVYALPAGCAEDIASIKTTSIPGDPTGDLYIAGRVLKDEANGLKDDGYFIGRLDGNIVAKPATKLLWANSVWALGAMRKSRLPWDVGPDGRVIYAYGRPHGTDWLAVETFEKDGSRGVVPNWRTHWMQKGAETEEFTGLLDKAPRKVLYSGIVLKSGRPDFRSWTEADWRAQVPDGNGGFNQGQWPFDGMAPGPYDPVARQTVKLNENGRGWYGYRWGKNPSACVGGIVVDRRDGSFYIGGNNQSKLPDGKPDFEPWVIAMDKTGAKKWWSRLYPESKGVSTPDQYVDGLAIDYSVPIDRDMGCLVVLARCHGNNVNNFWNGKKVQKGSGKSFQPQFSGKKGNAHYSWIGRMTATDGTMLAATFLGEYAEGAKHGSGRFSNPLLNHWPSTTSGWPDLTTTRTHSIAVDELGRTYVVATGRRVITTKNAFQQMPSPLDDPGKKGVWGDFVRVYQKDLSDLDYSSLLNGLWDWDTESGNTKVDLAEVLPVPGGVLVIGNAPADKQGVVVGSDMPTRNVPAWGAAKHDKPAGVFAVLNFK